MYYHNRTLLFVWYKFHDLPWSYPVLCPISYPLSCLAVSCHVLCPVLSCPLSCPVMSCPAVVSRVLPSVLCSVLSCLVLCCPIPFLSGPVLSCHVVCLVLSAVLSCPVLSCHVLLSPVSSSVLSGTPEFLSTRVVALANRGSYLTRIRIG